MVEGLVEWNLQEQQNILVISSEDDPK